MCIVVWVHLGGQQKTWPPTWMKKTLWMPWRVWTQMLGRQCYLRVLLCCDSGTDCIQSGGRRWRGGQMSKANEIGAHLCLFSTFVSLFIFGGLLLGHQNGVVERGYSCWWSKSVCAELQEKRRWYISTFIEGLVDLSLLFYNEFFF